MHQSTLAACAIIVAAGQPLQAFEFNNTSVSLGIEGFDYGAVTEETRSITGRTELAFSDQFGVAIAGHFHDLSDFPTEEYYTFSVTPYYQLNDDTRLGVFVENNVSKFTGGSISGVLYGLEGQHDFANNFSVSGYLGTGEHFFGNDVDVAGIGAGYQFNNGFDIGVYYRTEHLDGGSDNTRYGLTVGYMISGDSMPTPVYLSGYIGSYEDDTTDFSTLGLSITLPIGNHDGFAAGTRPNVITHSPIFEYYPD